MVSLKAGWQYNPLTRQISGEVEEFFPYHGADTSIAPVTPLMVDEGASKADVLKAVSEFVNVKGRRGQSGPVDYLKMLGALRLLREFGNWETALRHASEHRTPTPQTFAPTYGTPEQWSRAKSAAQRNCQSVMRRLM